MRLVINVNVVFVIGPCFDLWTEISLILLNKVINKKIKKAIISQLSLGTLGLVNRFLAQRLFCGTLCVLHRCERMPEQSLYQQRNMFESNQRLQLHMHARIQWDTMWNKWVNNNNNNNAIIQNGIHVCPFLDSEAVVFNSRINWFLLHLPLMRLWTRAE